VAISVGFPVAVNDPVPASQVGFQRFRVIQHFSVEGSYKRSDHGYSSNDYNFLLTVLSEGHFRILVNRFNAFHFFLATMGEGASQVD